MTLREKKELIFDLQDKIGQITVYKLKATDYITLKHQANKWTKSEEEYLEAENKREEYREEIRLLEKEIEKIENMEVENDKINELI